mmetsp:Transcript_9408/g.11630  ORF Transcript_9408/g.11630 Transcript_9408/m.11630 type:complete len:90 (+) Transcript_9408:311-580(+)
MKGLYSDDLASFIITAKETEELSLFELNKAQKIVRVVLLFCCFLTPLNQFILLHSSIKTQRFPCYISMLNAVENQICAWLEITEENPEN